MRKPITAIVAAGAIAVATMSAPKPAEARCRGCWIGAGIAASIIGGALFAASRSSGYGYYGYPAYSGYGPYYEYPGYGYGEGYGNACAPFACGYSYYGYAPAYRYAPAYQGYYYAPPVYRVPRAYLGYYARGRHIHRHGRGHHGRRHR
jgi:hypothetical protein